MDVNGGRLHLVRGEDWTRAVSVDPAEADAARFDPERSALTLAPRTHLFLQREGASVRGIERRRPAAADAYGNLYRVDEPRTGLLWWNADQGRTLEFWSQTPPTPPELGSSFVPVAGPAAPAERLAGVGVTAGHWLVVGVANGLLVFDLSTAEPPLRVTLAVVGDFTPDLCSAGPDGDLWLLDVSRPALLRLDPHFRPCAPAVTAATATPAPGGTFHPLGESPPPMVEAGARVEPLELAGIGEPIALQALTGGHVLLVHARAAGATEIGSEVSVWSSSGLLAGPARLFLDAVAEQTGETVRRAVEAAHATLGESGQRLYVVESRGSQALAFDLPETVGDVRWSDEWLAREDYLPMPYFEGRGLVRVPGTVASGAPHYDVDVRGKSGDLASRWVRLRALDDPRYARRALVLVGGPSAADPARVQVFDGREPGCVWHRVFLDACIPREAGIEIYTRAHDDLDRLRATPFTREPRPYRRRWGAEIPNLPGPADHEGEGCYESLLQEARGRFLQVRLELTGNGHSTPVLRALRIVYPRFSWPERFLPATYLEEPESALFTERLLANTEGLLTDLEGRIRDVRALFDPRVVPQESLAWLASWLGVVLDPVWSELEGDDGEERRRLFVRFARKLYERRGTPDALRFALELLMHPCPAHLLRELAAVAAGGAGGLVARLEAFGLPLPRPWTRDDELEDLLYAYLTADARPSRIRLVERYQTRGGLALAAGDRSAAARAGTAETAPDDVAHRFTVLVPDDLADVQVELARRLVELEKPAHTAFDVREYTDLFRIGEVRLGRDTQLGDKVPFRPQVLGETALARGYLASAAPVGPRDRWTSDRDSLGGLPAL